MVRSRQKDPLPGIFLIGVLTLGIGCFVRYKAWQADGKLRNWTPASATVISTEPFKARAGRYGTTTRYATTVSYETPNGTAVRRVVLNQRPASQITVYYDPSSSVGLPEAETHLRSVSSRLNVGLGYAFAAGGVVVLCLGGYVLRRRLAR